MDEELDLRAVSLAIVRRWKLILIMCALALVAGALVMLLSPPEYHSTATVAVAKPRFILRFDTSIQSLARTGDRDLPLGVIATDAYTIMAMNGDLKIAVLKELGWKISVDDLNEHIKIEGDSGVIQFTGKDSDPQKAAQIASAWARLYTKQLNESFSSTTPNIPILEQQLTESRGELDAAEKALADFQATSRIRALQEQYDSTATIFRARLDLANRLGLLKADATALQSRLQSSESAVATVANQFQSLILETLAVGPQSGPSLQMQFSLDSASLTGMSSSELSRYLGVFAEAIDKRVGEINKETEGLPARIAEIQQELTIQEQEYARLALACQVARDTLESLSRKVDEAKVQAAMEDPEVKLVSEAAVPTDPVWPKPALVLAEALLGGLMVGVLAAGSLSFFNDPEARAISRPRP